MLEMYHYEETLMKSSCLAFRSDVHLGLDKLQNVSKRGLSSKTNDVKCDLCRKHLALQGGHCNLFQCGHKYHLTCLQMAGCVVVMKGTMQRHVLTADACGSEEWQCYHCISAKISTNSTEDSYCTKTFSTSTSDKSQLKETEQWKETVEEITNHRIVKAQIYLKRFQNHQRHPNLEDTDKSIIDWKASGDNTSLLHGDEFPLRLAPAITSDVSSYP